MLTIRKSSIVELESLPNIHDLLKEYADEVVKPGMPEPAAQVPIYKYLEGVGALHVIAAFFDDVLIGYVTVLMPVLPHYELVVKIAVTESLFCSKAQRKTGAGLKLLRAARANAKERGATWLLVSAPTGGDLAELLPLMDEYEESNRVFITRLSDE